MFNFIPSLKKMLFGINKVKARKTISILCVYWAALNSFFSQKIQTIIPTIDCLQLPGYHLACAFRYFYFWKI